MSESYALKENSASPRRPGRNLSTDGPALGVTTFAKASVIPRHGSILVFAPIPASASPSFGASDVGVGFATDLETSHRGANSREMDDTLKLSMRVFAYLSACLMLGIGALVSTSCSSAQCAHVPDRSEANRKPAPNFTLKDASGKSVNLADYRGKVVLLNFWATWCGPCQLEIPWFEEFQQQYRSRGFEVLGVSMDDDGWQAVKPYLAEHKVNYRVVLGDDSVAQLYGGLDALPTTYILDRDGRIAYPPHVGLVSKSEYLNEIQKLLGGGAQTCASLFPLLAPAVVWNSTTEQAHR